MEQIMVKNETITKIRRGSIIIMVLCLIAAAFNFFVVGVDCCNLVKGGVNGPSTGYFIRYLIDYGISAVIMLTAAVVFFRISKNGRPFTRGNIWLVRLIGVLFIVNAVVPLLANAVISENPNLLAAMMDPTGIVEGILFLFLAQIMHYGALLQQESDETL